MSYKSKEIGIYNALECNSIPEIIDLGLLLGKHVSPRILVRLASVLHSYSYTPIAVVWQKHGVHMI